MMEVLNNIVIQKRRNLSVFFIIVELYRKMPINIDKINKKVCAMMVKMWYNINIKGFASMPK